MLNHIGRDVILKEKKEIALLYRVILDVGPCFHDLEYFFPVLLVYEVSFEKSADSLMGTP